MKFFKLIMIVVSLIFLTQGAGAQMKRADVAEQYKWNLNDLYDSDKTWQAKKESLENMFNQIQDFKGTLSTSSEKLLQCLDFQSNISKEMMRLLMYARMNSDLDTRDTKYQGMTQQVQQMSTRFSSMSSFIEPEILAIDKTTIDKFIQEQKGLQVYEFYLNDLQRKKSAQTVRK